MRSLGFVFLIAVTACSVPDKFLSETDGGDDMIDGGGDDEPDAGVDTTPPETTITSAPPANANTGASTFEFEADEDATFLCSVDGTAPSACVSPFTINLVDDSHAFSVRAIDLAGNQDDTPAEHLWRIDTDPPDTTITVAPAAVDNSTMATFEFSADETGITFECSDNGSSYSLCVTPHVVGPLTDGSYMFGVRAVDAAGNTDPTPDTHAWTIDTSTPDTVIDSGPNGSVASAMATFTFSSPDAGAGATFECSLDGAAFATCTSPRVLSSLTETAHTFQVRVRDSGGNLDPSPASRTWTVDVTAPTTMITVAPSGSVASASAAIEFTSNEAGTFQCSLDGGSYAACSSPHNLSSLAQGSHTLAVRAVDLAGTQDASPATATWTVDTVAPNTSFASTPPASDDDATVTFDLAATESPVTYECSLDMAAFGTCSDPAVITIASGSHNFRARATDAAGNTDSTPATYTWSADTTAPVVTFTAGPANGSTSASQISFAWTVDDAAATLTCLLNGAAVTPCTSGLVLYVPEGPAQFRVEARDAFNRIGSAERNWTVDCVGQPTGPGAIGLFHFDEGMGNQTVDNALSGFADATLGASAAVELSDPSAYAAGRFNTGFRFTTTTDNDQVNWSPGTTANTVSFTIAMWVKPQSSDGAVQTLFVSSGSPFVGLYQAAWTGQVRFGLQVLDDNDDPVNVESAGTVALNQWHYVVGTFSGTTATLYLDGTAYSTTLASPRAQPLTFSTVRIGSNQSGTNVRAVIDEVYFSNRSSSPDESLGGWCPQPTEPIPSCPVGYGTVGSLSHKYRAVAAGTTWGFALGDCVDDLPGWTYPAIIDSASEQTGVASSNRWLGILGYGAALPHTHRTVRGDPLPYTSWSANEPNGPVANTNVSTATGGLWIDDTPASVRQYVCECDGL